MNKTTIRTINNSDIGSVMAIYNFHIVNSLGNFEEKFFNLSPKLPQSIFLPNLPSVILLVALFLIFLLQKKF